MEDVTPPAEPGCMFCGGNGEDVGATLIPQVEQLGDVMADNILQTQEDALGRTSFNAVRFDPNKDRIHPVCAECVNGWIANVDSAGYPVLVGLNDGAISLNQPRSRAFATLAAKRSVLRQQLESGSPVDVVGESAREFLSVHLLPPQTWSVWVARLPNLSVDIGRFWHGALRVTTEDEQPVVHGVFQHSYRFGELGIVVMGQTLPPVVKDLVGWDRHQVGLPFWQVWPYAEEMPAAALPEATSDQWTHAGGWLSRFISGTTR